MIELFRKSEYISDELMLDKLESFMLALKLLGYHMDIKMQKEWLNANIRFSKELSDVEVLELNNELMIEALDGEVINLFAKVYRDGKREAFSCGERERMFDMLDKVLSYI